MKTLYCLLVTRNQAVVLDIYNRVRKQMKKNTVIHAFITENTTDIILQFVIVSNIQQLFIVTSNEFQK